MGRIRVNTGIALLVGAVLAGASACSGDANASGSHDKQAKAGSKHSASAKPKPKPKPSGPPMLLETIAPQTGTKVGVAMPISVVFTNPVAAKARAGIEKKLKVSASQPVDGAWHWFGDKRVDWRPKEYWPAGTKVKIDAEMTGVANGNGRYGVHDYHHTFTVGDRVETNISVTGHTMKVSRDGKPVRTMPINAGSPKFPSWNGTMAVVARERKVRMKSCSVGIACSKSDPNYYDLTLPWDVQLTYSGTYVHYSNADPAPGHGNGSHGCVHLSLANAKWYYGYVKQGDPITITGSTRGKAAGDNGFAAFTLSWSQWLAGSAAGVQTAKTL